jgi:hypothetical protein
MASADFLIHEGPGIQIVAVVDYDIIPASGDGWHEPHEPAQVDFKPMRLVQRTRRFIRNADATRYDTVWDERDLGPAPPWVDTIIEADDDWLAELAADDGPDPDTYRDDQITRELNPA